MSLRSWIPAAACIVQIAFGSIGAQAQGMSGEVEFKLVDRVAAPLAYLRADLGEVDEEARDAIFSLFDGPTARALSGAHTAGETAASSDASAPDKSALAPLRKLLARTDGDLELVLAGLLPRPAAPVLPLMLCRAHLDAEDRDLLATALSGQGLAEPLRQIGDHQTYRLAQSVERPGELIELALIGRDLFVSNHGSSMEGVLRADSADSSEGGRAGALSADPDYQQLKQAMPPAKGSVELYLRWGALWHRWSASFGNDRLQLLSSLGLEAPRHALASVRSESFGLRTTVIFDASCDAEGILAAARPTPAAKIAKDLPTPALASLTLALDPRALANLGCGAASSPLSAVCSQVGIDFDEQIASRLGRVGSCQLVVIDDTVGEGGAADEGDTAEAESRKPVFRAAFSLKARDRRAAKSLLERVGGMLEDSGRPFESSGRGAGQRLAVPLIGEGLAEDVERGQLVGATDELTLGIVGESLVGGFDPEVLDRLAARERELGRAGVSRHHKGTLTALQKLRAKGEPVGVFDLDFRRFATSAEDGRGRHAGSIHLDEDIVRIEMLSPR